MTLGTRPRQRLTVTAACTAQVMMVLDVMIVSVALPSLQHELRLSPAGLEWVVSAYALALAALIPTGGALGDHFGRRRVFMSGIALFALASVGCALSDSGEVLIGFRVIQGIGGAVMSCLTLSLIVEAYPPKARTGPIGLWAAVSGLAVAGGSVVGGLLLSVFPWSSIFWVNVPLAVVTLVITQVAVVESREREPRPFDTGGVALSAAGLLLLTFGFVESSDAGWRSPVVAACIIAGVAVLVLFFVWERGTAFPMVPPALLRTPSFGRACAVYLLAYLAFSGFIYYLTLFFQNVDGWSALRTGLSWLFFCIPYFAVAQLGKSGRRRLAVASAAGWGCLIAAAGMLGMSQLKTATPFASQAALLHPGGSGLRADGPGGFVCGDGRGCGGIIGNRVRPVQRLPPDRYRDGTGHPRVHRHRRGPGRLAPPGGILPPPSGGGQPTSGPMSPVVRSMPPPPTSAGTPSMRRWPHFSGASSRPTPGGHDSGRRWSRGLPGLAAPPEPGIPGAPNGRCEHKQLKRVAVAAHPPG